jgi:hypothetical protein
MLTVYISPVWRDTYIHTYRIACPCLVSSPRYPSLNFGIVAYCTPGPSSHLVELNKIIKCKFRAQVSLLVFACRVIRSFLILARWVANSRYRKLRGKWFNMQLSVSVRSDLKEDKLFFHLRTCRRRRPETLCSHFQLCVHFQTESCTRILNFVTTSDLIHHRLLVFRNFRYRPPSTAFGQSDLLGRATSSENILVFTSMKSERWFPCANLSFALICFAFRIQSLCFVK